MESCKLNLQISVDYVKYNAKEKEIRNSIKDELSNRIKISFARFRVRRIISGYITTLVD